MLLVSVVFSIFKPFAVVVTLYVLWQIDALLLVFFFSFFSVREYLNISILLLSFVNFLDLFPYTCSFLILLFLCKVVCKTSWTCMKLHSYLSDLDTLGPRLTFVLWRDPVAFQTLSTVGEQNNRWYNSRAADN